ncbi:MAG: triacylglycerol lipase [Acidimicrobiaceae bacterium]|jgi:triacylglycerol lipase|nr:triacylglycerol lipase [Acidimicrobiaceae bacterium]
MQTRRIGQFLAAATLGLIGVVAAGEITMGPVGAATPSAPDDPAPAANYPVPYTFLANILAAPTGPNTPPPGANDWTCRPSAIHPEPVVLVHGLMANETDNWQTISPLLADNGYCVFALTYGTNPSFTAPPLDELGGLMPMEQSAAVLATFVDKVLAATGATKVDLVGHSEGATMPDYYLKFLGGSAYVDAFVGLAPVVHGTEIADPLMIQEVANAFGFGSGEAQLLAPVCAACQEFAPHSAFTEKLDTGGVAVPGVRYTQIMTTHDELVVPYTSGEIAGSNSTNIVVQQQCPLDFADHVSLASDPVAAQDVLNGLDPAQAQPPPCTLVAPIVG